MWRTRKEKKEDQIGKEKGEDRTRKEKREGQTVTKVPVALAGLRLIKPRVKGPEEAAMRARRPRKAITGEERSREAAIKVERPGKAVTVGAKRFAYLSLPTFLLSPIFLSLLTSLTYKQAFFLAFDKHF